MLLRRRLRCATLVCVMSVYRVLLWCRFGTPLYASMPAYPRSPADPSDVVASFRYVTVCAYARVPSAFVASFRYATLCLMLPYRLYNSALDFASLFYRRICPVFVPTDTNVVSYLVYDIAVRFLRVGDSFQLLVVCVVVSPTWPYRPCSRRYLRQMQCAD
jgi:hypothetical protein